MLEWGKETEWSWGYRPGKGETLSECVISGLTPRGPWRVNYSLESSLALYSYSLRLSPLGEGCKPQALSTPITQGHFLKESLWKP